MASARAREPVRAIVPIKNMSTAKTHGFTPLITAVVMKSGSGRAGVFANVPAAVEFWVPGAGIGTEWPVIVSPFPVAPC